MIAFKTPESEKPKLDGILTEQYLEKLSMEATRGKADLLAQPKGSMPAGLRMLFSLGIVCSIPVFDDWIPFPG
jgi:hypothetical protein